MTEQTDSEAVLERAPRGGGTLVLTRSDVAELLDLDACIAEVERAFRAHGEGRAAPPALASVHVEDGAFHVKAGVLRTGSAYYASKTNANFMGNRRRWRLPTIQGTIVLHDAVDGYPLAVMDSIEISIVRTGSATAVAARHLARADSGTVAVAGCGAQGRIQLLAIRRVLPVERAIIWDTDPSRAAKLADELRNEPGMDVSVTDEWTAAARESDACVTCTPSERWLLGPDDVRPGTFIAGVGADNPHKSELSPDLLAANKVVVDVLEQCAAIGDLHHAIAAGAMTAEMVHGELGAVVAGRIPGRESDEEVTIFDSTGMALQDVATAALVYERALASGVGRTIDFSG